MGSPVTTVTLSNAKASGLKVDALVVGVTKGPNGVALAPGAEDVDKAFKGRLAATVDALGGTGAKNEVTKVSSLGATSAQVVVAVGLGATPGGKNATPYDDETIRRAVGTAVRSLVGTKRVGVAMPTGSDHAAVAAAEGALFGAYAYRAYRVASRPDHKDPVDSVVVVTSASRESAGEEGPRAGAHRRAGRALHARPRERTSR